MRDLGEVDPELLRQLDSSSDDVPVSAAVSVRRTRGKPADPDLVNSEIHEAVDRAEATTGLKANAVRVLGHLAVAYVEGPSRMIRVLLDQPEVTGAMAGRPAQPNDESGSN